MASATVQDVRDFLGDTGGLSDPQLSATLLMAKSAVVGDGVSENHDSFATLQILFTCHLLEVTGAISGKLASKSVADISVSYAQGSEALSYRELYNNFKTQVLGFAGRIV